MSKWQAETVKDGKRAKARRTRQEIVVRVEPENDSSRFAEWGMPKIFGFDAAMDQAILQTKDEDMRPE